MTPAAGTAISLRERMRREIKYQAFTVLTAVVVALTLLPALLGFVGARILPRKQRTGAITANAEGGAGFRWTRLVTRFRTPIVIGGVVGLGVLAIPMASMQLTLPDGGTAPAGTHQRIAYDLIAEAFGPGANGPLIVVVKGDTAGSTAALVTQVTSEVQPLDDVVAVTPGAMSDSGRTSLVMVIPASGPPSRPPSGSCPRSAPPPSRPSGSACRRRGREPAPRRPRRGRGGQR